MDRYWALTQPLSNKFPNFDRWSLDSAPVGPILPDPGRQLRASHSVAWDIASTFLARAMSSNHLAGSVYRLDT